MPEALDALFKVPSTVPASTPNATAISATGPMSKTAHDALDHYESAIAKLKAGDWSGFGAELDALQPLLEQMNRQRTPVGRVGTIVKPVHQ
jgi:uncharacterized membrane protein (UPF0182 family)